MSLPTPPQTPRLQWRDLSPGYRSRTRLLLWWNQTFTVTECLLICALKIYVTFPKTTDNTHLNTQFQPQTGTHETVIDDDTVSEVLKAWRGDWSRVSTVGVFEFLVDQSQQSHHLHVSPGNNAVPAPKFGGHYGDDQRVWFREKISLALNGQYGGDWLTGAWDAYNGWTETMRLIYERFVLPGLSLLFSSHAFPVLPNPLSFSHSAIINLTDNLVCNV